VVRQRRLPGTAGASAREALEAIQQAEYDIALIDIKMPGMDGMELQGRLREADADLTVIIMTAMPAWGPPCRRSSAAPTTTSPSRWIRTSFPTWWARRWSTSGAARGGTAAREPAGDLPQHGADRKSPAMRKVLENIEMVAPHRATC